MSATATEPEMPAAASAATRDEYPRPRRFSRTEYYRAAEAGVFAPDERLELIQGEIVVMSPMGAPHAVALAKTQYALLNAYATIHCHVRGQLPLRLSRDSEPEPDVAVVRGAFDDYSATHPTGEDALLLVEISDATLVFDRTVKAAVYAQDGVAEYWILNLRERTLEVRREPENGTYPPPTVYGETDAVTPSGLAAPVRVADLLPLRIA